MLALLYKAGPDLVVPQFVIRPGNAATVSAKIESIKWSRLRCRVQIAGEFAGCKVDLRDKPVDPATSLTGAKAVGPDGSVSLPVADDSKEGTATTVVLLDSTGGIIAKAAVTVGG